MQNDSPVIDFSRPVLWWWAVRIAMVGGLVYRTYVRATDVRAARVLAAGIRADLRMVKEGAPILVYGAAVGGAVSDRAATRGLSFAGYADE